MINNTTFYTLLLSLLPGIGPGRIWAWQEIYGTPEKILLADPDTLPKITYNAKVSLRQFHSQGEMSPLACKGYQVLESLERQQATLLTAFDPDYSGLLKKIYRPPPLLFAKGNIQLLSLPQIAIIGTRNPTRSGLENTRLFGKYLAKGGFAITSGLALGIDGAAHKAALEVGGKTVAVTATGIDQVYPKQHLKLADSIIDNDGLIVTEFMPGTEAHAARFPQRNRIISGLSLGVLVIEAAAKSGSLITARYALEQNREVFAVPSSIHNPQAKGCHSLIKQGAHLIETGEDIIKHLAGIICLLAEQQARSESSPAEQQALSEINASPNTTNGATKLSAHKKLSNKEQKMVNEIGYDRVHIEQLIDRTGLASAEVAAILLNLEIKGIVKHSDWGYEAIQSLTDSPGL